MEQPLEILPHPRDKGLSAVFAKWRVATIAVVTKAQFYDLLNDEHFYSNNSYAFEGMPEPVTGEVGYSHSIQQRIRIAEENDVT
jgi:hypothetical protein